MTRDNVTNIEEGRDFVAYMREQHPAPRPDASLPPFRERSAHSPAVILATAFALMPMTAGLLWYASLRKNLGD